MFPGRYAAHLPAHGWPMLLSLCPSQSSPLCQWGLMGLLHNYVWRIPRVRSSLPPSCMDFGLLPCLPVVLFPLCCCRFAGYPHSWFGHFRCGLCTPFPFWFPCPPMGICVCFHALAIERSLRYRDVVDFFHLVHFPVGTLSLFSGCSPGAVPASVPILHDWVPVSLLCLSPAPSPPCPFSPVPSPPVPSPPVPSPPAPSPPAPSPPAPSPPCPFSPLPLLPPAPSPPCPFSPVPSPPAPSPPSLLPLPLLPLPLPPPPPPLLPRLCFQLPWGFLWVLMLAVKFRASPPAHSTYLVWGCASPLSGGSWMLIVS